MPPPIDAPIAIAIPKLAPRTRSSGRDSRRGLTTASAIVLMVVGLQGGGGDFSPRRALAPVQEAPRLEPTQGETARRVRVCTAAVRSPRESFSARLPRRGAP